MAFWNKLKTFGTTLKYLPGEMAKTAAKLPVPGRELARGLAYLPAISQSKKAQESYDKRQQQLADKVIADMKEAATQGDMERVKRLEKISFITKSPTIIESVMNEAPTTRQVIASSGELALLAVLGYKPTLQGFGKTGQLVSGKAIKGLTTLQKTLAAPATVGGKILQVTGRVAKEAVIGGAFWGTAKAKEKDAEVKDIIKAAEKGAVIGGLVAVGAEVVSAGVSQFQAKVVPKIKAKYRAGIATLEKIVAGKPKVSESQMEKTLSYIGQARTLKQKAAALTLKVPQIISKAKMRFVDRFSALQRAENRISDVVGRPLKETEKVYRNARLTQSVADAKAEKLVIGYMDDLAQFSDDIKTKATAYMTQLDFIDRAKLGQTVAGKQSLDDLTLGLKKLVQEIGPDDMQQVGQIRKLTNNYNSQLLQRRVDAGLISKETMNVLRQTHPNYIPHNVILDLDDRVVQGLSSSLNVPKTDIMKAVGSARNIDDPFVATIQRTPIATRVIEKNMTLTGLVEAQEAYNIFPGMQKITTTAKVSPGFDTINFFRGGIKERWQVPQDIAIAIKNLDAPATPGYWKFLTTPQRILKKFATQYNLSFAIPNKFRDKQTAFLTADAFIEEMAKRTGVSAKAVNLTRPEIKDLYKISGGYGGSIFREGESRIFKDLQKIGVESWLPRLNPAKMIDKVNDAIEQSTRLDVFNKALTSGLASKDAAIVSRNATIDFAKMGTWMKPLNQAIPFLNARVQGFVNLPKAFVASPQAFARMQMYTAVYPTVALQSHNRRFKSYKSISQYFKNRYWIIMTGETESIDSYSGENITVPQFITIPKGEGQQLVSGPIQYYLDKADGVDFRKTSEMLADVIGSASPLEFQSFDSANWFTTAISQFGPLATVTTGLGFGKHPYFGTEIVPEGRLKAPPEMQFKKTTPEVIKKLGEIMKVSPAKVEFVLSSFGGLSQDLQRVADIAYNVVREGKLGGHSISETPTGSLTQIPIVRRFLREAKPFYAPETQYQKKQKEEIETKLEGKRLKEKDKAEEIFIEMKKKQTKQEALNYLNSFGDELTSAIRKRIKALNNSRQSVEVLKKSDSVELRARYILQRLEEMYEQKIGKEDAVRFLNDLEEKKILTPEVKKLMQLIKYAR